LGLSDEDVWALGYAHVEIASPDRKIKACGVTAFRIATDSGLTTDVNGPPFPRHVDLIGWPSTSDEKHFQMMCATKIANKMQLRIDPRSREATQVDPLRG